MAASRSVSAALAVLAGIAASDAVAAPSSGSALAVKTIIRRKACSNRSRPEAWPLPRTSSTYSTSNVRDLKDGAHYGGINVSNRDLTAALRRSSALVDEARARVRD